ncbi:arrestin homolog [Hyalella azteca]|uniref:Arrestin homolog n=1 Tax=Hyalella azteca TaxID=294128 RepID=A0A8B7NW34_HYAAZ|nr:arrestin homolog [Hyalella azteca]
MVNAVKVFKKTAPNGKLTVYLGRRDFVDNTVVTEPVDGVVLLDNDYLKGRKVFATVTVTYRFGREEDEVMGLNFSKELQLTAQQIFPASGKDPAINEVQERLVRKLGPTAHPFAVNLPCIAPASVILQSHETAKPLGVIYELKVFVAETPDEKLHKRNSVSLAVRKVQYAPQERCTRQPSTLVSKGFTLSSGKLNLEVTLEKDIYYHGEQIIANLGINNCSRKTVKNIKCSVVQHVEVTMTNTHFTRIVASLESKEGCPITPGSNLQKAFQLHPTATTNKNKGGVALDGKLKDSDANLASSTLVAVGQNPNDALGIVISYSLRVVLNCGALGGELVADLPFKLVHPSPALNMAVKKALQSTPSQDSADNIVFEDFARIRRGMSVDQP